MVINDPKELGENVLSVTQKDRETARIKFIEAISNHHDVNSMSKSTVKFKCSVINGAYEKVLSYNQILEYLVKDVSIIEWKFNEFIGHQGPIS